MNLLFLFVIASIVINIPILYFIFSPKFLHSERILVDLEDDLLVAGAPIARVFNKFGKIVPKSNIAKVQVVGKTITLFNKSDNAIDIWITRKDYVEPVVERIQLLCKDVEMVRLEC